MIITEGLKRRIKRLSNFVAVGSETVTKTAGSDRSGDQVLHRPITLNT